MLAPKTGVQVVERLKLKSTVEPIHPSRACNIQRRYDIAGVEIATVLVRTILRVVRRLKHGTRKVGQADLDVEQPGHGVADEDEHGAFSPGWDA
mmetsp:Transcript_14619/g.24993  ORF Transcript_14619/g.24993 Transcript_14619/m.24993 type:complete len:94 (+) Transcript_14619:475-756(+)